MGTPMSSMREEQYATDRQPSKRCTVGILLLQGHSPTSLTLYPDLDDYSATVPPIVEIMRQSVSKLAGSRPHHCIFLGLK